MSLVSLLQDSAGVHKVPLENPKHQHAKANDNICIYFKNANDNIYHKNVQYIIDLRFGSGCSEWACDVRKMQFIHLFVEKFGMLGQKKDESGINAMQNEFSP